MYRFLLSPRWLALHAITLLVMAAFITLGWWQFQTYELVDERQRRLDQEPVAISELARPGQPVPEEVSGRRVTVSGRYAPSQQVLVPNRVLNRVAGSYVITPLVTADGATVPVLRGWIHRAGDPGQDVGDGPVTVTGVLVQAETEDAAQVALGDVDPGEVAFIAPETLASASEIEQESVYGGFLLLSEQEPAADVAPEPIPAESVVPGRGTSPWQNLSYWLQWWVFAAAAGLFWASFVRSAIRDRRSQLEPSEVSVQGDH